MRHNLVLTLFVLLFMIVISSICLTINWMRYKTPLIEKNVTIEDQLDVERRVSNSKIFEDFEYFRIVGEVETRSVNWPFVEKTVKNIDTVLMKIK